MAVLRRAATHRRHRGAAVGAGPAAGHEDGRGAKTARSVGRGGAGQGGRGVGDGRRAAVGAGPAARHEDGRGAKTGWSVGWAGVVGGRAGGRAKRR